MIDNRIMHLNGCCCLCRMAADWLCYCPAPGCEWVVERGGQEEEEAAGLKDDGEAEHTDRRWKAMDIRVDPCDDDHWLLVRARMIIRTVEQVTRLGRRWCAVVGMGQ